MKNAKRPPQKTIWDHKDADDFVQKQMETLDLRDNLPPQMLAVISSVLEALDTLEQGEDYEG